MKARPAHVLRMIARLSKQYPDLDFSAITTIDKTEMQHRFNYEDLAGIYFVNTDSIFIGLAEDLGYLPQYKLAKLATTLLHEVIHRKQYTLKPLSKSHGKTFQKLCLKYGLDPRIEIEHDKGQKLKVKVPYTKEFFATAVEVLPVDYQDFYRRKDVSTSIYKAAKKLAKEHENKESWKWYVNEVYRNIYYSHYPTYRACYNMVSNYHITKDTQ